MILNILAYKTFIKLASNHNGIFCHLLEYDILEGYASSSLFNNSLSSASSAEKSCDLSGDGSVKCVCPRRESNGS